ncbi:MAG: 3-methyl-2-oxobutanoate hydroxymethyltransferase [Bacteroidaceae bacterium]
MRPITVQRILKMKSEGKKISMLTSYDYTMASIVDSAGVDMILIGDSASNVMAGNETTLPITLDEMIYHAKSVVKAAKHALVVCDMPFGSYQVSADEAVRNAIRIMKESGCDAVKLEGGKRLVPAISAMVDAGVPVVGHLGLTPPEYTQIRRLRIESKGRGRSGTPFGRRASLAGRRLFCFGAEKIPASLAAKVSAQLSIPVIGIGAGNEVDGQVLVAQDMLGMNKGFAPKFLRRYADLYTIITDAVQRYVADVKSGDYPNKEEQY